MHRVKFFTIIYCSLGALFGGCTSDFDNNTQAISPTTHDAALSVKDAQEIYNNYLKDQSTRGDDEGNAFFESESATPLWESAKASQMYDMSAVDIDFCDTHKYMCIHYPSDGDAVCVNTVSKILAIKSSTYDETTLCLRLLIPNAYDTDLSDNAAFDFVSRGNFSGVEYISALDDGTPIAAARFRDGVAEDYVFMGDTDLSPSERLEKLYSILDGIAICRIEPTSRLKNDEWNYGKPGEKFLDHKGNTYVYIDTNGDGKADAITQRFDFIGSSIIRRGGGGGNSYSDKGNIGKNNSQNAGTGSKSDNRGKDKGNKIGTIINRGKGGGTIRGNKGISDSSYFARGEDGALTPEQHIKNFARRHADPFRFISLNEKHRIPKPTKPKSDPQNCIGDPLINMEILGSKNNGIQGGRYGYTRGTKKKHNGCDFKAKVGTPVFAMFDGIITYIVNEFDGNVSYRNYEKKYGNNTRHTSAGNRIWLECKLNNGETIRIKYFHLDKICVPKGAIKSGMQIGTTGQTGSACSSDSAGPHLHVEVWVKKGNGWTVVNPEPYFYSKFDSNGKKL